MKFFKSLTIIIFAGLFVGCDALPEDVAGNITINSVNGGITLTDFAQDECFSNNPAPDKQIGYSVIGNVITTYLNEYPSTDGTCTGAVTTLVKYEVTVYDDGDATLPWNGATPQRADTTGPLPNPVTATKLRTVFSNIVDYNSGDAVVAPVSEGEVARDVIFVDDTTVLGAVYYGDMFAPLDGEGYPTEMESTP